MSWTVQEDPNRTGPTLQEAHLEQILQKVVDDDDDYVSPSKLMTNSGSSASFNQSGSNQMAPAPTTHHQSLYTKSSQVFTSPAPLIPADLATPVKDPLESFNSWVRTQTPNSGGTPSRGSPTPGGGGQQHLTPSNATSPPSGGRPHQMQATALPYVVTTPQKHNASAEMMLTPTNNNGVSSSAAAAIPRSGIQLDSIIEHRKQLMMQMEELALQEQELRHRNSAQSSGGAPLSVQQQNSHQMPAQLNPTHLNQHDPWGSVIAPNHQNSSMQQQAPLNTLYPASFPSSVTMVGSPSVQSPILTAESIRGRVYETAKDQHGCRFLQRWLDNNFDGEATQCIMTEIIPHVAELMTDQYANFLVQKLFDIMPHDVRYSVAQVAAPHLSVIALTPHGTFSVQKLIETIATREEMEIVREALGYDVVRLVKDVHGNHVIQKVLQRFEHPDKQFIYDAVSDDCVIIATNKQGCCVLQRCLEYASPTQHKNLVTCILSCCLQIVQDPFGNYVLQYVLEANDPSINDRIATIFLLHLVPLSMNKFSSNVMEKVLRGASQHIRDSYVETMKDPNIIAGLIQDDFGNYVVQTALTMCSPGQAEALVVVVRPLMPLIRNAPYAKKLEAKMDLIVKKKSLHGGISPSSSHSSPSSHGGMSPNAPHNNNNQRSQQHHHNNMGGGVMRGAPLDPFGDHNQQPQQQGVSPNRNNNNNNNNNNNFGNNRGHHHHNNNHSGGGGNPHHQPQRQQQQPMPPHQHMTPWSNNSLASI